MTSPSRADITTDRFLDGRLTIRQPARGYRAGVDAVLLAAAVPAQPGQSVLDLGCGVGVAGLCLQSRVGRLQLAGLEVQPDYATLARENAEANGLPFEVITGDVSAMPAVLRERSFDHVLTNPPYYDRSRGTPSAGGREVAMGEAIPLATWIDAAIRRLAPRGSLTVIQRADRLHSLLTACDDRVGDLRVLPLAARQGRAADRVILRAVKGARGPLRLLLPLVQHVGSAHLRDGDSYCPEIAAVLRNGAALPVEWR